MPEMPMQESEMENEGEGQGGFAQMVSEIYNGLGKLGEVVAKANPPPGALEKLQVVMQGYQEFVQSLSGGGQPAQEPAQKGVSDQMAGPGKTQPAM